MTLINHPRVVALKGIPGCIPTFLTEYQQEEHVVGKSGIGGLLWTSSTGFNPQATRSSGRNNLGRCMHEFCAARMCSSIGEEV